MKLEADYRASVNRVYEEVKKRLVSFSVSIIGFVDVSVDYG